MYYVFFIRYIFLNTWVLVVDKLYNCTWFIHLILPVSCRKHDFYVYSLLKMLPLQSQKKVLENGAKVLERSWKSSGIFFSQIAGNHDQHQHQHQHQHLAVEYNTILNTIQKEKGPKFLEIRTHKKTPIYLALNGKSMGRIFYVLWSKDIVRYRECTALLIKYVID